MPYPPSVIIQSIRIPPVSYHVIYVKRMVIQYVKNHKKKMNVSPTLKKKNFSSLRQKKYSLVNNDILVLWGGGGGFQLQATTSNGGQQPQQSVASSLFVQKIGP